MATIQGQAALSVKKPIITSKTYDWFFLIPALWFFVGVYLDSWAHLHIARLETFFTPWHAVLYSGFLVVALGLVGVILINRSRGATWQSAIPQGYDLSVLGMIGFAIGGVGDLFWHVLFGIEQDFDAAFSPTHLILMVFGGLFLAGPYRSLYRRAKNTGKWQPFLVLCASILFLAYLTVLAQEANPLATLWPLTTSKANQDGQILAFVSIIFQSVLYIGFTLYTIRRWRLFPGFFTLLLTINTIPLGFLHDDQIVILIAALAGLLTDGAYFLLQPSLSRPTQFRIFAALAGAILYAIYLIILQFIAPIVWTIHLAVGSIAIAAITGWLLSYCFLPGVGPTQEERNA